MMDEPAKPITSVPTPWREIVLVCRKCSKRIDGGFGRKQRQGLRTELRDALRAAGRRREVRVIEIGCVGLCPKNAVTVARASRPQELLTVPRGSDPADVLRRLDVAPTRPDASARPEADVERSAG